MKRIVTGWFVLTWAIMALVSGCGTPPLLHPPRLFHNQITIYTPPVTAISPLAAESVGDQAFCQMVYGTLVTLSPTGTPEPELANTWTMTDGGRVWLIHLNPYAKWWSGRPVAANDVVWSLALYRARHLSWVSPALDQITVMRAVTPTDVLIRLNRPDPAFMVTALSPLGHAWILPAFLLDRLPSTKLDASDYLTNVNDLVGMGPFRPYLWSEAGIRWTADPHYFLGAPHIRQLHWVWKPSSLSTAQLAFIFDPSRRPPGFYEYRATGYWALQPTHPTASNQLQALATLIRQNVPPQLAVPQPGPIAHGVLYHGKRRGRPLVLFVAKPAGPLSWSIRSAVEALRGRGISIRWVKAATAADYCLILVPVTPAESGVQGATGVPLSFGLLFMRQTAAVTGVVADRWDWWYHVYAWRRVR